MEPWRDVWRRAIGPYLEHRALMALRKGLAEDDPRLMQGATTVPPPLQAVMDWPVEGADAIGYAAWQGMGMATVGEAEEFFARFCSRIDKRLGEPKASARFLDWWDTSPRATIRLEVLLEIDHELAIREKAGRGAA